jgi:hypothetical protein
MPALTAAGLGQAGVVTLFRRRHAPKATQTVRRSLLGADGAVVGDAHVVDLALPPATAPEAPRLGEGRAHHSPRSPRSRRAAPAARHPRSGRAPRPPARRTASATSQGPRPAAARPSRSLCAAEVFSLASPSGRSVTEAYATPDASTSIHRRPVSTAATGTRGVILMSRVWGRNATRRRPRLRRPSQPGIALLPCRFKRSGVPVGASAAAKTLVRSPSDTPSTRTP